MTTNSIPASIEVTPGQAQSSEELPYLFPPGTHVYLTDIGTDTPEVLAAAAKRVRELGYEPVPHVAARRLPSRDVLAERVERLSGEAGVRDVLVIGGGLDKPAGPFTSTMDVLDTGLLDAKGIRRIGVAGHPEGSPDFDELAAIEALRTKREFAQRTDADLRIVTQFGFDSPGMIAWANSLAAHGVDLPVHMGVAGPATLKTLMKFAALCGVGASVSFLKRNALRLASLATTQSPEGVVAPIEAQWRASPGDPIAKIHVFPFGGLSKASAWLTERGSWPDRTVASLAAE